MVKQKVNITKVRTFDFSKEGTQKEMNNFLKKIGIYNEIIKLSDNKIMVVYDEPMNGNDMYIED